ncbi:TPA: DUF808 domain-containing protein [Pseudomonas aeruginosa]
MAGASLLTLLDDIAAVLDDVSLMTKVAAKKTAGVLGDDLALNAQQVTGVNADRELPVVWAVAKGSLRNKAILVPAALLISAFAPWAVIPLLMLGGAYLCFEGFEKIAHKYLPHDDEHADEAALAANVDVAALEKQKIGGAIRTDFILSAEIIAITLGTVAESSFTTQVLVLVGIALVMTIGVYGLVAGIVKLDDAGLYLSKRDSGFAQGLGGAILRTAPYLMKGLSVVGMAAMFMVGGGILTHGIPVVQQAAQSVAGIATLGPLLAAITPTLLNFLFGIVAGAVVLAGVLLVKRLLPKKKKTG